MPEMTGRLESAVRMDWVTKASVMTWSLYP